MEHYGSICSKDRLDRVSIDGLSVDEALFGGGSDLDEQQPVSMRIEAGGLRIDGQKRRVGYPGEKILNAFRVSNDRRSGHPDDVIAEGLLGQEARGFQYSSVPG